MSEPTAIAQPAFLLLAWGAGLVFVGGGVTVRRIVGPGFTWLTAAVAALVSLPGALSGGSWWARGGLLLLAVAVLWTSNRAFSGIMLLAGGVLLIVEASQIGGVGPAISAAAALGGVTGEMLLGHWYLIDPRLPRSALRFLALTGIFGLLSDAFVLALLGLPKGGVVVVYWVLMATSVLLMGGVLGALRYPAYAGVMAATGLSYLAVLTTLGGVFLGRVLVAGLGPFGT